VSQKRSSLLKKAGDGAWARIVLLWLTGALSGVVGDDGTEGAILCGPSPVSLDELVPADHFYRHLERSLDLGFVRDLVRDTYAEAGRPSIDPVVFFKLQLIRTATRKSASCPHFQQAGAFLRYTTRPANTPRFTQARLFQKPKAVRICPAQTEVMNWWMSGLLICA
jgi:hypothetical protein